MFKYQLDYYTNTIMKKGISKLIPSYYLNKAYNNYNKINLNIDRSRTALLSFDCDKNTDIEVMERLLTILSDNHIIANFAIPACYIKDHLSLMKNAISSGHELLNHSFSHPNNFVNLSLDAIKKEIQMADLKYKDLLSYQLQGFRAPHFGWFYYDGQKLFNLFEYLSKMHYRYSSSTVLTWFLFPPFKTKKYILNNIHFREFPLSPSPIRPFEAFDSYYFFKDYRSSQMVPFRTIKYFLNLFSRVIYKSIKYNIPLNIYLDPQDVIKNNLIHQIIELMRNNKLNIVKYSDIL